MNAMGPRTSDRINFLVTMAIAKSVKEGGTVKLEITCNGLESMARLKNQFESVIKAWGATEHEGLWVGALQKYRWSIELEFIAL